MDLDGLYFENSPLRILLNKVLTKSPFLVIPNTLSIALNNFLILYATDGLVSFSIYCLNSSARASSTSCLEASFKYGYCFT